MRGDFIKNLLLIVDFQDMFATDDVGFELGSRIEKQIVKYLDNNDDIAFTIDEAGANLVGGIGEYTKNAVKIFNKSSYGSLEFGNWLLGQEYEKIEVCGLLSNICVLANVVIARSAVPKAEIIVDKSLTACYDDRLGEKNLAVMGGLKVTVI